MTTAEGESSTVELPLHKVKVSESDTTPDRLWYKLEDYDAPSKHIAVVNERIDAGGDEKVRLYVQTDDIEKELAGQLLPSANDGEYLRRVGGAWVGSKLKWG